MGRWPKVFRRRSDLSKASAIVVVLMAGCDYDPFVALCRRPTSRVQDPDLRAVKSAEPSTISEPTTSDSLAAAPTDVVPGPRRRREPELVTVIPAMTAGIPPTARLQPIDADEPPPKIAVERIELSPLPERAPIDATIVAIARLTDADGNPVSNVDVEWALDSSGVGTIIAAGGSPMVKPEASQMPQFARSRTSQTTYRLDPIVGTGHPLTIEPGDSWCVLRTNRAGLMIVSARSPDIESPARCQWTRPLHWIEATLQTETIVESSSPYQQAVVAQVQTASGRPLAGYPVLFAINDESGFFPRGVKTWECVSDSAGFVRVELDRAAPSVAASTVTAKLFEPPSPAGAPYSLEERTIEVRWPSPSAEIVVQAPQVARVRSNVSLAAEVRAIAPTSTWNAKVAVVVGDGLQVLRSNAQAVEFPRRLRAGDSGEDSSIRFVLASVEADGPTSTQMLVTSQNPGERIVRFEVRDGQQVLAWREVVIRFVEPLATVDKRFPKDWRVGRTETYQILVRNPGPVPLEGLVVEDEVPPGLRIEDTDGVRFVDRLRWEVARLAPAEEKQFEVRARPLVPFEKLAVRAWAKEPFSLKAEGYDILNATGIEALELAIEDLSDPLRVGEEAEYHIRLVNRGSIPARNVELTAEISSELRILSATGELRAEFAGGELRFAPVESLESGRELVCRLRARATKEGDARIGVRVHHASLGDDGVLRSESTHIYK